MEEYYLYKINNKQFGITPRNLSYWRKKELITGKENRNWHKYSFKEVVWLKTIEHLRKINIAIETIKLLKDLFFNSVELESLDGINDYAFIVYINDDDCLSVELLFDEKIKLTQTVTNKHKSYIYVPIDFIFQKCKLMIKKEI
jgi:DNA-binding transcriptional MerR regulator